MGSFSSVRETQIQGISKIMSLTLNRKYTWSDRKLKTFKLFLMVGLGSWLLCELSANDKKSQWTTFSMLLLLLSRFSCVQLCVTPQMTAHQAPPSLGFSRQEHEWVAISFSNAWKWKVKVKMLSRIQLLATPWSAAYQAPPSMGFSRQEYWSGVPSPSPTCTLQCIK